MFVIGEFLIEGEFGIGRIVVVECDAGSGDDLVIGACVVNWPETRMHLGASRFKCDRRGGWGIFDEEGEGGDHLALLGDEGGSTNQD